MTGPPRALRWLLLAVGVLGPAASARPGCAFEPGEPCEWRWTPDWAPTNGTDPDQGYFLFATLQRNKEARMFSPRYSGTRDLCRLELLTHMENLADGNLKVVVETVGAKNTSWVLAEQRGNDLRKWEKHSFTVGRIKQEFTIVIEVIPGDNFPSHVALDNIQFVDCFIEKKAEECLSTQFHCANSTQCIDHHQICDMSIDCPDGNDERQNCDKVNIEGSRCNFELGMCGWTNEEDNRMSWTLHAGPTETDNTGPSVDHTYKNSTGKYTYVEMSGAARLGEAATIISPLFNPPPPVVANISSRHYNTCYVSFYYHQYGPHSGSLTLMLKEQYHAHIKEMWRSFGDQGNVWKRVIRPLPPISQRYQLYFEAKKSFSMRGDVAIDDFNMSPQCFGIGEFTKRELNGYDYSTAGSRQVPRSPGVVHASFKNKTYYVFTTCGTNGTTGPTAEDCSKEYNNTTVNVTVVTERNFKGIQKWTVPKDGFYTIIASGASGGGGASNLGTSRAAEARLIIELFVNKDLYILTGQQGISSSKKFKVSLSPPMSGPKILGIERLKMMRKEENGGMVKSNEGVVHEIPLHIADFPRLGRYPPPRRIYADPYVYPPEKNTTRGSTNKGSRLKETLHKIKTITVLGGGGGGGGASYVFYMTKNRERVPLLVGAGGGGLAHGPTVDDGSQHGNEPDKNGHNRTGDAYGEAPAGAGGGWLGGNYTYRDTTGLALVEGSTGGSGCVETFLGHGGFGGGGGGCTAGGGGGGFSGGRAWSDKGRNGEGGFSYVAANGSLGIVTRGASLGDGRITIIPAVVGCGCEYRCVALDIHRSSVMCICPTGWELHANGTSCVMATGDSAQGTPYFYTPQTIVLASIVFILAVVIGAGSFSLYGHMKRKTSDAGQLDLSLSHLQHGSR